MTSCRSCVSCERELSAVRLDLQAVVRERDRLLLAANSARILLERHRARYTSNHLLATALNELDDVLAARAALSRERKDTVKPALTRWEAKQLDAMDAGERKDTNA